MLVKKYNLFLLMTYEKFTYHFSMNISETNTVRAGVEEGDTERISDQRNLQKNKITSNYLL